MTSYNDKEMKDIFIYQDDQKKICIKKKQNKDCDVLPPCACIFLLRDMFSSFWGTILLLLGRGNWLPGVGPGLLLKYSIFRAFNENKMISHQYHKIYLSKVSL